MHHCTTSFSHWSSYAILFLILACCPTALAETFHAATNGVDTSARDGLSPATAWRSISYAVAEADAGDTIYVIDHLDDNDEDDFIENITIDKQLEIRAYDSGASNKPSVKAAASNTPVFDVNAQGAVIEGLFINGATTSTGIQLTSAVECQILDNTLGYYAPNNIGVSISGGYRNILRGNLCYSNNATGIELNLTYGNVLYDNVTEDSGKGIHMLNGYGNVFISNVIWNNDDPSAYGLYLDNLAADNFFCSNVIEGNYYGIWDGSGGGNVFFRNLVFENIIGMFIANDSAQDVFLKNSFYDNSTTIGCAASSPYNIGNDKTLLYRYNSRYFTAALGNYYSNYSGSDSNGDGLGDTAYQDATPPPYQFDNTPIMFQETYWFELKAWMLWAQGSNRRLYQDNSSGWAPPLLFSGSSSQVFSDSTAAQRPWSYCGGDPSDDSTWSGWLTFAAPLDAGHEVSVTLGISDADGANFQARIPTVTITGDGGSSKLEFTAPKGCLVLPAGKRLAVRIENLDSDPFHLMASGAACVLCAPLASHRGAPSVPYSLLLE